MSKMPTIADLVKIASDVRDTISDENFEEGNPDATERETFAGLFETYLADWFKQNTSEPDTDDLLLLIGTLMYHLPKKVKE